MIGLLNQENKHIDYYRYSPKRREQKNSQFLKKIAKFGVSVLLYLFKFFIIAKRFLTAFFVILIFRPLRQILRFVFYKIVVKIYGLYLKLIKRLGWPHKQTGLLPFVFYHKSVHVLVVVITALLIIVNLTPGSIAGSLTEKANHTILAELITSEFSDFEEDEQFIIESFDKEATISDIQQSYLDNLDSFRPQPRVNMNDDEESVYDEMPTTADGSSIVKPELAATQKTKRARTETVEYIIEPGDTISTIAQEFEVSVSTILWENDLSAYSIIRPGSKLRILPTSGLNHKILKNETISSIAKKYDVEEDKILEANKLATNDPLQVGQELMVPGAKKAAPVQYATKSYTGFSAIKDIVNAPGAKPVSGNKMNWPTEGSRITQYYSWRHHGLDIGNKTGTPIYAADAGTIETVGWGKGYGYQVVINHGGGKKTRYAHLSKFFVEKGDTVSKGQTIAAMGSTGWSTGPHLHFEVIINGNKYNPLNYIK